MPISIFEDVEKKIPEWKEIFIGQDTQDHELKIVLKNSDFTQELPVLVSDGMDSAIKKLQYQIIKNFSSGNSFHLDLVNFLETNLFGKISLKEKVSNTFWINKEKSFSERETELLQFLVSELLLLVKKYKGSLEKEILEIAIASLLNEGKISEVLEISSAISLNNSISTKLSLFMYLIGESKELDLGNMEEDSILFALCELKQSRISETKKEALYDTVISGNSQNLIGVVYNLYSKKISGIRNALPLFQIVLKKYSNLTIPEKKIFIDDYLAFGFYFRSFFLMKKVYSTGEIKQKLANLNYINGKKKHPEPSQPKEDSIPLSQKYEMLKNQGLIYTLTSFELLTLLNSQVGEIVKQDILAAISRLSSSYLIQRAYSVLLFFEKNYESFFQAQSKSGRLKYGAESLYLKAIALKEIGLIEEGHDILVALERKFPESYLLKSAIENHKI